MFDLLTLPELKFLNRQDSILANHQFPQLHFSPLLWMYSSIQYQWTQPALLVVVKDFLALPIDYEQRCRLAIFPPASGVKRQYLEPASGIRSSFAAIKTSIEKGFMAVKGAPRVRCHGRTRLWTGSTGLAGLA